MKNVCCLICMTLMLTACGNSDNKLPQECRDLISSMETLNIKMQSSIYATPIQKKKYEKI